MNVARMVAGVAGSLALGQMVVSGVVFAQELPARIKIGVIDAVTGPAAPGAASSAYPGIKLAIKELQDRGGTLAGRPVDFVFADDGSDPTQTSNEARRLVSREGINAAIGPQITGLAMAAAPVYNQAKIVSVGTAAAATFTPQLAPYWFVPYYSSKSVAKAVANFLADDLKVKNVALLAGDGASDKSVLQDVRAALLEKGLNITGEQSHETRTADMTPQLLSLRKGNPEIIFEQSSVAEDGAKMLTNLDDLKWNVPVVSTAATFLATQWIKFAGPDAFKNHTVYGLTYSSMLVCKSDPLGASPYAKFVERIKAFDPENFPRFNMPGVAATYDAATLLFTAIDQTKSVNGDVLKDWIYKNAATFKAVTARMQTPTSASHFLFGPESIGVVDRPDVKRADGTMPRAGC